MSDQAGAYATRFGLLAQLSHWRQRRVPERGLNQRIDPHIAGKIFFRPLVGWLCATTLNAHGVVLS